MKAIFPCNWCNPNNLFLLKADCLFNRHLHYKNKRESCFFFYFLAIIFFATSLNQLIDIHHEAFHLFLNQCIITVRLFCTSALILRSNFIYLSCYALINTPQLNEFFVNTNNLDIVLPQLPCPSIWIKVHQIFFKENKCWVYLIRLFVIAVLFKLSPHSGFWSDFISFYDRIFYLFTLLWGIFIIAIKL